MQKNCEKLHEQRKVKLPLSKRFTVSVYFFQSVQGILLAAGTVGIKFLIAKVLNITDDVSMLFSL